MKKLHRVLALLLAALMVIGLMTTAFAEPTIDPTKEASLSIYKYDITKASNDGAWDAGSYVSPACTMMPPWTSWQSMPSRAWSSPTSALLTSP